jgi:phosphoribosylformylglycinamidine synthase I
MKAGVLVFPGSNCDEDTIHALKVTTGCSVDRLWHAQEFSDSYDLLVLPGGFSYGDYLRTGAIAAHAPAMQSVRRAAAQGRLVLGICNGFQILVETGLLPGALLVNKDVRFHSHDVYLKVENNQLAFTLGYRAGQVVQMPIAHGMGNYFADEATLAKLSSSGRIVFRYCDASGAVTEKANPNGACHSIAGIANAEGNVLGLMPHPERNAELVLGTAEGALLFTSIKEWLERQPSLARPESPRAQAVDRP